jgi:hypothetical protein
LVVEVLEQGVTVSPALTNLGNDRSYGLGTQGAVELAAVRMLSAQPGPCGVGHRAKVVG